MRLDSLEIENFRRFRDVRLEFPDGVIGLVGRNGAGKSSLLEAIGWALFGHEAARTGKDLLRRRGAGDKDDCRVTLRFRFGGASYEVQRALVGKSQSHTARLSVDGHVVVPPGAQSHREVTNYLERAFHMDRQSFFTSLVARQKELNALTDMTPGARQRVVLSMLRIDAVDDAIRLAREEKRDRRQRLEGILVAAVDPKVLEARGVELERARVAAADARERLAVELDALGNAAAAARAERDASQERAEAHARLSAALAERRARLDAAEREAAAAREDLARLARVAVELESRAPRAAALPDARRELERLQLMRERHEEVERRRGELEKARSEVARLAAELARAREAAGLAAPSRRLLERVRAALAAEREKRSSAELRIAEAEAGRASALTEARRVERKLTGVRDIGPDSPCPTCTRPLKEHYGALTETLTAESAEHLHTAEALRAVVEAARGEALAAETRERELAERERELSAKVEELVTLEARTSEMERRLAAEAQRADALAEALRLLAPEPVTREALDAARARVADLERAARRAAQLEGEARRRGDVERLIDALQGRVADARAAVATTQGELEALAFDAAAHRAAVKAAEAAQEALSQRRVAFERALAELRRVEEAGAQLAADRKRQEEVEREAASLREEVRYLERLAADRDGGLLADFKAHLIARVRPALSQHAGRAFRDLTDGRYSALEVDEEYDLMVTDEGEKYRLERFSGGESDLANLCLRLAVSQVLAERAGGAEFQFIALDEVFGSQDEIRKGNILRALSALSSKFRQILVVTHVEDVKDAVEHVIRVRDEPDGSSTVSIE